MRSSVCDYRTHPPDPLKAGVFCMRIIRPFLVAFFVLLVSLPAWAGSYTVIDQAGRTVTVPAAPARIISLAPNITEILFAVGAGKEIVGVSEYSDYPPEAAGLPAVGSYIKPNLEAIIALKPDLVIATADGEKRVEVDRLASLGVAVYIINPRTIAGVVSTVREIGRLSGHEKESEEAAREMERRIEQVRVRVVGLPKVSALLVLNTNPLITVNGNTFQHEMIAAAGGKNIAGAESIRYPTLTYEEVVVRAPEVIIMTTMSPDEDYRSVTAAWLRFCTVPAVKTGRIFIIDSDIVDRPSPRMVQGLEELARLLHPEAFKKAAGGGR
jgi:iron complex transport system substrate-binding protein